MVALALAVPAGATPADGGPVLAVPYLPQTEALCGGAAAAMVFRYWGDRHADVQQFAPLVDRRSGGIADTVLVDAIRERGWNVARIDGSAAVIREHLQAGRPLILLIEDRPKRYHFVVAVGADDTSVFLHDPTWGPSRRLAISQLMRVWQPTSFWALLVMPGDPLTRKASSPVETGQYRPTSVVRTSCDRLLDGALDEIAAGGLTVADEAIGRVRLQCPTAAGPLRELAGVRFSQERWRDAASLAEAAVGLDAGDAYAWDVLGSSRFLQNDPHAALRAWNRIGKPILDSVRIDGLTHARHSLIAEVLGLQPNTLLTDRQLTLAGRRLQQLPDRLATSLRYQLDADGFATADATIVERPRYPRDLAEWTAVGTQALINREVTVAIPGNTGQGEVWGASWRWWDERPRVAVSFSAPRAGRFGGVWRVEGAWEAQTYALEDSDPRFREERAHGGLVVANWLTPNLRYEIAAGLEAWNRSRRAISVGGQLERRFLGDRLSIAGGSTFWPSLDAGQDFISGSVQGWLRSSDDARGFVALVNARADTVSGGAPHALWSGAGEGRARPALLRAHPLLQDGVIDGPVFGRHTASANVEIQRWLDRPVLPRMAVAAFTDLGFAADRLRASRGRPFQVDVGVGWRVRIPGADGTLRFDYGRGLRDRADAIMVGWTM